MPKNIQQQYSAKIIGTLDIQDNGRIFIEVEGQEHPFSLPDFLAEFDGKLITLTIKHETEF